MRKNFRKGLVSVAVMSLIVSASIPQLQVKAAGQVNRIGEMNSYATAAKIATLNWTNPKDVVLVCGEGYADAVSATVLAKQLNAPILLTTTANLNDSAKNALDTLKPQNIYIIGGTASVSETIRTGLKNSNYNLIELGGKNRYETNLAVANQLIKLGVKADNVMLVSGEGFSDILSATSVAAAKGQIILLGNNEQSATKPIFDFVKANNSKVTVIGTNYSINEDTYKALRAVKRVNGGANRFETNLNVLKEFSSELKNDKMFIANSSGDRYTDALIAASLAGKSNCPLILVDNETSSATTNAIEYIKNNKNESTDLSVIGKEAVLPETIINRIKGIDTKIDAPTVSSITTNGLNQVKVIFNTDVDEDSAELVRNYQIEGADLGYKATAELQEDRRTVLITFSEPFIQYNSVIFTVKNTIMDKNQSRNIEKCDQKITFSELTPPVVETVTVKGGNRLVVKFSEPVRMTIPDLSTMKINRQSISNLGLNNSMTVLHEKSGDWSDRVELYFNTPLPLGNNVFSIPNGERGKRFDNAAGYLLSGVNINFKVEEESGNPQVIDVTSNDSDTIYVKYDRNMDKKTALEDSNYELNGSIVGVSSSDINFEEGSGDTVVKIRGLRYLLKKGENKVTIKNKVTDSYGTEIKESSFKFYVKEDNGKPEVTSVSIVDNETIRIKFSKEVSYSYATNKANYKLVDSYGSDVTYKIDRVQESSSLSGNYRQTYDVKFKDKNSLKDSKYTLTVKNIIDTNSNANVMDTYTKVIDGLGNQLPTVKDIVKSGNDNNEVVIFFSKPMDVESITSSVNYFYINGIGENKNLPSSSTILPSPDRRSVTISIPSGYTIGNGPSEYYIHKMGVANVKDEYGNVLATVAHTGIISTNSNNGPKLISGTARLMYDGDDVKVKFSLTDPLDIVNVNDFRVSGQTPDGAIIQGNDVILTFRYRSSNNDKVNSIKNAGSTTSLSVYGLYSVDVAGRKMQSGSDNVLIPPSTVPDSWTAESNKNSGYNSAVTIVFNQEIDDDIENLYIDDFAFANETTGEKLNPLSVDVQGRNIIYKFSIGSISYGDKISVKANDENSVINIRSEERNNGERTSYSPSSDDLRNKTINAR